MSNPTKSVSVSIGPVDSRCRYWAKIVRKGELLPMPSNTHGANDIPGPYVRNGEDELLPGDTLIQGEARHHRKQRGWNYAVTYCTEAGEKLHIVNPGADVKAALKGAGVRAELLPGSGGIAACVRVRKALQLGMLSILAPFSETVVSTPCAGVNAEQREEFEKFGH